ncbi:uncharacterized protein [Rutidosis leptorrhynchoides]|uniref:uncharacterized protein n=1 Tax=Rutidosis leptorrhynchoides TaxID=125765 RepID=UPI003A9A3F82
MKEELYNNFPIYKNMFDIEADSLLESLEFVGSPCPPRYWMKMPYAGILIANKFGVIFHCLSMRESTTFFPLWNCPEEFQHHRVVTIAHVNNGTHFVAVKLQGDYPMPPTTPFWHESNISDSAATWKTIYMSRLQQFTQFSPRKTGFGGDISD